ncbi:MAG: molybdopterin-dependent oxidoreductase, partial [Defluviicoccus sp.]|nr:molybdopterin-dependent oxidoreductase [Bryobacterales bacterium]MDE0277458.1 molybdopterin-dependent oxidoreductase [Defluviicoccus sp.]
RGATRPAPSIPRDPKAYPQVNFNIEQLVDQAARDIGRDAPDPIKFRRARVLDNGDLDVDGKPLVHDLRNKEVLAAAAASDLWLNRHCRQQKAPADELYGVGFAMAMEAYGTTSDGSTAALSLTDDYRLVLDTEAVEMGQGAWTGLAQLTTAVFGRPCDEVRGGRARWLGEPLSGIDTYHRYASTTSASKSIFFGGHVVEALSRLWWRLVWLPVVAQAWNAKTADLAHANVRFENGHLVAKGRSPLTWASLCDAVLASGCSRMWAHGSFHGVWSWAKFKYGDDTFGAWLDALALMGNKEDPRRSHPKVFERLRHIPPNDDYYDEPKPSATHRSVYATAGCLVAVRIDMSTGKVQVSDAMVVLDAGDRADEELVKGQVEGGFAQALGYALSEEYPSGASGGQRLVNFDSYALPRLTTMPEKGIETVFVDLEPNRHILAQIKPPPGGMAPPPLRRKGIAEVSLTPVAPAIANAIHHALSSLPRGGTMDTRATSLPITAARVRALIARASNG